MLQAVFPSSVNLYGAEEDEEDTDKVEEVCVTDNDGSEPGTMNSGRILGPLESFGFGGR
jgi:hypothetical protein